MVPTTVLGTNEGSLRMTSVSMAVDGALSK